MTRGLLFSLPIGAAIALHYVAAAEPTAVESLYSARMYPRVAASLNAVTRQLPFALADWLAITGLAASVVLIAGWARHLRSNRRRTLASALRVLLLATGTAYLAFLMLWGLNYRRQPLAVSLGLQTEPAPLSELSQLAAELIEDANALRHGRREEDGAFRLEAGIHEALGRAGAGFGPPLEALPHGARPKGSLFSPLLARLGISGIFVPFTGEALVDTLIPEVEMPFSASHELAHLQGWAREDEASFVAYTACRAHAAPDFRYSGALMASLHASAALAARDGESAKRVAAARAPAVVRDVAEIRAWQQKYEGPLSRLGDRVNDSYLRSQGDPRGLHSYGRMVDLLLAERRAGTRSLIR
ncbi:MAG TPA: DUF3810 domain-containing protein [Vicinamibacteria bacterium]|nr:DUF3810 domain-containing protein [Vicinamibacteria bacterium]